MSRERGNKIEHELTIVETVEHMYMRGHLLYLLPHILDQASTSEES